MSDTIDYGNKMHCAMRALIAEVLGEIQENGLPGEHHFFITFDTTHPDVEVAEWLFDRYPKEMTIVIQHWYDALIVGEDGFKITLNFGDRPENLTIPFDAIRTFVDPSVEFGLRFETQDEEEHELVELPEIEDIPAKDRKSDSGEKKTENVEAEVVSLDKFRK